MYVGLKQPRGDGERYVTPVRAAAKETRLDGARSLHVNRSRVSNLACSSRTGECWSSVAFVRCSLRSVRTATTSGQYSTIPPSRSVS